MAGSRIKIAVLDDYQNIALGMADWSSIPGNPEIKVFNDHLPDIDLLVQRLLPFDVLCIMRERTPMAAALLDRLPNLKLIASTGARNSAIDLRFSEHPFGAERPKPPHRRKARTRLDEAYLVSDQYFSQPDRR